MGSLYDWICPKCGFSIFERSGIGLSSRYQGMTIRQKALSGNGYPELKELFEQYPNDGEVMKVHGLFQCPVCKQIKQSECIDFKQRNAGEPHPFFQGLRLPKLVKRFYPICDKCGVDMDSEILTCPHCGTELNAQNVGCWD